MVAATQPIIEARAVAKRYGSGKGSVTALRDISFEIRTGEFVAVMGPSGSGKTSLMNLIGCLDEPTSGVLSIAGVDITRLASDAQAELRNRRIGFVFQAYHLLPRRSAIANVELPLIYRGLSRHARTARAEAALSRVSMSARKHALPGHMSGGEQQRVAIARALVTEPDVIIADEPTGALDTSASNEVLDLLEQARDEGRTVLLVTHDPTVAQRASRVIEIRDGRIVGDDGSALRPPRSTSGSGPQTDESAR